MNEQKKPDSPRPSSPEPIPVRELRFRQGTDIPGKTMASSVTADPSKPEGKPYWQIDFFPHLRSHRVTFFSTDRDAKGVRAAPRVLMVHETWCSWEPV
jgi:hypothetical protein